MKFPNIVRSSRRWLSATPERALDAAYRAALKIKAIEDDHFKGEKVTTGTINYSQSVLAVFRADVNNYLQTIKVRLTEFNASRAVLIFSDTGVNIAQTEIVYDNEQEYNQGRSIIEKLNFIEEVVSRYKNGFSQETSALLPALKSKSFKSNSKNKYLRDNKVSVSEDSKFDKNKLLKNKQEEDPNLETISDKTAVLPRSFLRTIDRIRQEIDPQSENTEEQVLKKFRRSRNKTAISIRFLLILIIVPLLAHQLSKTFIVSPFVEKYFSNHQDILFINKDLEEEAFVEFHRYEEKLEFKSLIGLSPALTKEEMKDELHDKAEEIAEIYRHQGIDAIGNVFADLFSLAAFAAVIFFCKREILIIKSFLDEIIYGLSDSAKAFLIILLTDMFVGYHSPHGWEIILEGISRHLGLPENRDFNFLFIATFPVILDTVLKYWIFRYLNRISPSSVATYKNMNE
ncbi:MAG: proton extrusion protein PcxA [Xenococcaceae cyanobacterium MO_188.B32]|nr:proton extrusion protein PcxA [Xenococcaceae cyanobacterium MO_188.B32]